VEEEKTLVAETTRKAPTIVQARMLVYKRYCQHLFNTALYELPYQSRRKEDEKQRDEKNNEHDDEEVTHKGETQNVDACEERISENV